MENKGDALEFINKPSKTHMDRKDNLNFHKCKLLCDDYRISIINIVPSTYTSILIVLCVEILTTAIL